MTYSEALVDGARGGSPWRRPQEHQFPVATPLPAATKAEHLQGIAEADETYFPYSCKGRRHLARPRGNEVIRFMRAGPGRIKSPC